MLAIVGPRGQVSTLFPLIGALEARVNSFSGRDLQFSEQKQAGSESACGICSNSIICYRAHGFENVPGLMARRVWREVLAEATRPVKYDGRLGRADGSTWRAVWG
jgi:hypothetical protein